MIKTIGVISFFITSLYADICPQTLLFDTTHHLEFTLAGQTAKEEKKVKERLYINQIEDKKLKYTLFWFGDVNTTKSDIDIESINAPFLMQYNDTNTSYKMEKISILSKDKEIEELLWAKVNLLQFASKDGEYQFQNGTGYIEVEQTSKDGNYSIKRDRLVSTNKEPIEIKNSILSIETFENNCSIWKSLELKESVSSSNKQMKLYMKDDRELKVLNVKNDLPKDHWFYQLSADISTWGFEKKQNEMTLDMAQALFKKNQKEMQNAIKDTLVFGDWIKNNMDFLKHLDSLLEKNTLDDNVSKKLFAKLGYLNSVETTNILSSVTLNQNILEKERFRGLMGLKNTSAPLDDEVLYEILDYGLDSDNSPDTFMQNMTGMIAGGLAKERMERSPEQAEKIINAIINTMNTNRKQNGIIGCCWKSTGVST